MRAVVAAHGHCFDGFASAAVFTRMLERLHGPNLQLHYHACGYNIGQLSASDALFQGEVNALLDYRYVATDKLTWYFDHHRTAFANDADRRDFEGRRETGRFYFEPTYGSCTQLIYDIARQQGLLEAGDAALEELVAWADKIDTAGFASAAAAVDRSHPVLRFAGVVELHGDDAFFNRWLARMRNVPVSALAEEPEIKTLHAAITERHDQFTRDVERRAEHLGRVVLVDLTARPVDLIAKFVTYALYPDSMYSVVVARQNHGYKLSIGYNPWCGKPIDLDISAICARYGGGGHRVVGGISLGHDACDAARLLAHSIARELNGDTPSIMAL